MILAAFMKQNSFCNNFSKDVKFGTDFVDFHAEHTLDLRIAKLQMKKITYPVKNILLNY